MFLIMLAVYVIKDNVISLKECIHIDMHLNYFVFTFKMFCKGTCMKDVSKNDICIYYQVQIYFLETMCSAHSGASNTLSGCMYERCFSK